MRCDHASNAERGRGEAFGVTVEDEGGATTPTLPIVLAGE
jgi:hypothetical protein